MEQILKKVWERTAKSVQSVKIANILSADIEHYHVLTDFDESALDRVNNIVTDYLDYIILQPILFMLVWPISSRYDHFSYNLKRV